MNEEMMAMKEEAILFAKDKIEDAAQAVLEFFPDLAEELNWFLEEIENQLGLLRGERLAVKQSSLYAGEAV